MADWADIDAIRDYLYKAEPELRAKAGGGKVVDDFRLWYAALTPVDRVMQVRKKVSEAKWYRDRANAILGRALPEGWIPADAASAAETTPPANDPTPHPPLIPGWAKVGGVVLVGLLLWHLTSAEEDDE